MTADIVTENVPLTDEMAAALDEKVLAVFGNMASWLHPPTNCTPC